MKNSTLSRKPGHDMKKNVGAQPARTRADQSGDGEDFAFNGQMGDGVNRSATTNRYAGNQSGKTMSENYGLGPRRGNETGRVAGSDTARGEILGKRSWEPKCGQNYTGNADKIYMPTYQRKGNA